MFLRLNLYLPKIISFIGRKLHLRFNIIYYPTCFPIHGKVSTLLHGNEDRSPSFCHRPCIRRNFGMRALNLKQYQIPIQPNRSELTSLDISSVEFFSLSEYSRIFDYFWLSYHDRSQPICSRFLKCVKISLFSTFKYNPNFHLKPLKIKL